jgi:hypothetical protein
VLLSGGRSGSVAGSAENIGGAILFGDVSDDRTECDDNYVGQRDCDLHCVEDAMLNHYCCTEMDAADFFPLKMTRRRELRSRFYTNSMQIVKYSDKNTRGYWPSKESYFAFR